MEDEFTQERKKVKNILYQKKNVINEYEKTG